MSRWRGGDGEGRPKKVVIGAATGGESVAGSMAEAAQAMTAAAEALARPAGPTGPAAVADPDRSMMRPYRSIIDRFPAEAPGARPGAHWSHREPREPVFNRGYGRPAADPEPEYHGEAARRLREQVRATDDAGRAGVAAADRVRAATEKLTRSEREYNRALREREYGGGGGYGGGRGASASAGYGRYGHTGAGAEPGRRDGQVARELAERLGSVLDRMAAREAAALARAASATQGSASDRPGTGATTAPASGGHGGGAAGRRAGWAERGLASMGVKPNFRGGIEAGWRVGQEVMHTAGRFGRIDSQAFVSDRQRAEQYARALPFGVGSTYGLMVDAGQYASGNTRIMRGLNEARPLDELRGQHAAERQMFESSTWGGLRAQGAANLEMHGLRLDRPRGHDRGTVSGSRAYEEEARVLPYLQQRTVAMREKQAAEAKSAHFLKEEQALGERAKKLQEAIVTEQEKRLSIGRRAGGDRGWVAWATGADPGRDPEMAASLDAEKRASDELKGVNAARRAVREQRHQATEEGAHADDRARQADRGALRVEFGNAQNREQRAESQAERLASLGQAGRMEGKFALQAVRAMGMEYAPPELIAQAEAYAPETVKKMKHEVGDKLIADARSDAPEEYADDLTTSRKKTDAAREKVTAQEEQDRTKLADELNSNSVQFGTDLAKAVKEQQKVALDAFRMELEMGAFQRQANGG